MDRVHEDHKIEGLQQASASLSIGILFLAFAAITGIFFFQAMRSGTRFWEDYIGILGTTGALLTAIGLLGRHRNS